MGRTSSESGFTVGEILVAVGVLCLAWFTFFAIADWIYNTKQNRSHDTWLLRQEALLKNKNTAERAVGAYQVYCTGLFNKVCR